jgi:hypothetical protein
MQVAVIPRATFMSEIWSYEAGDHVSFIGPTGSGKTYLANPLLARSVGDGLPGFILVMKRRDKTVSQFLDRYGWRRSVSYPIPPSPRKKPPGWVIWPHHTADPDADDERMSRIFHEFLRDAYVKGDRIIFADEIQGLVEEMGLKRDLVRIWARGRSEGCGLWAATQRPYMAPQHMYSQAEHIFLAFTPDRRDQDRFAEIGGVDPELVTEVVKKLPRFCWLYIRRSDRVMCVVGP